MATAPLAATPDYGLGGKETRADYTPDGYGSADDFIQEARELYHADREADRDNLLAAQEDLEFAAGKQWGDLEKAERDGRGQPSLTYNKLPQFVGQVVGDRRINATTIKVHATEDADVDIAEIRADLIRGIEVTSRADRIYMQAFEAEVTCGIGNFRIDLDYAREDVFEKDVLLRPIPNPLAVTWDYMAVDPTGRDAGHCFVDDIMPRKSFEKRWPSHKPADLSPTLLNACNRDEWLTADTVRVTEYWRLLEEPRTLAMMQDGKVIDVTDRDPDEYMEGVARRSDGRPVIREAPCRYAEMHLITGYAILEAPVRYKLSRLPIIRCTGREIWVGNKRERFGLVRFAKDPQRLENYWNSVKAEILSKAPRQQWAGPASAFEGREHDFRNAHITGDPIIKWNDNATTPPQQLQPVQYPAAFAAEAQLNAQYIKDVTGIQDASLGTRSNETSGRAIMARQHEGDVATVIYHDNMNAAIQEAGDVINQFIPQVYDTARTVRVVGADEEARLVRINDPMDPDAVDLSRGRYDVTISTGPAYMTRRLEAADSMIKFMQAVPAAGAVVPDLVAKAQDWPDADEFADRLKRTVPPQVLGDDSEAPDPAQQQQQQMAMQAQEQAMQMQQAMQEMEMRKANAEAAKAEAEAVQAAANARKAEADAEKAEAQAEQADVELHGRVARTLDDLNNNGIPDDQEQQPIQGRIPARSRAARKRRK